MLEALPGLAPPQPHVRQTAANAATQIVACGAGVYTHDGSCLLGTSVSQRIRVLANNDVPTGAAFIPLIVPVA